MEKLATLQLSPWKAINEQAEHIYTVIERFQKEGKHEVSISGSLYRVNKEILKVNGFDIIDGMIDFPSGKPYYIVKWSK